MSLKEKDMRKVRKASEEMFKISQMPNFINGEEYEPLINLVQEKNHENEKLRKMLLRVVNEADDKISYATYKESKELLGEPMDGLSQENIDRLYGVICNNIQIECEDIKPESNFKNDFGLDSLDFVNIIIECEKEFNIALPDDKVGHVETVQELTRVLELNI